MIVHAIPPTLRGGGDASPSSPPLSTPLTQWRLRDERPRAPAGGGGEDRRDIGVALAIGKRQRKGTVDSGSESDMRDESSYDPSSEDEVISNTEQQPDERDSDEHEVAANYDGTQEIEDPGITSDEASYDPSSEDEVISSTEQQPDERDSDEHEVAANYNGTQEIEDPGITSDVSSYDPSSEDKVISNTEQQPDERDSDEHEVAANYDGTQEIEDPGITSDSEEVETDSSSDEESDEEIGQNNGFADLLEENANVPLFHGLQTSKSEALLMILSFAMRHCLSSVALLHLFELFNAIFDRIIFSSTKGILKKIFGKESLQLSFHFYCSFCFSYVQLFQPDNDPILPCPTCNEDCFVRDLTQSNFFITADLTSQIRTLLEKKDIARNLSYRHTRQRTPGNIEDIYDGSFYKEMSAEGKPLNNNHNLSYIINSDGLPVFKSSKYSLWPIYLMINELPPKMRMQNLILAGVWFGKTEPKMEMFLNKFVDEAKLLSTEGVLWSQEDRLVQTKLFALCCCVDAPARASMQNTVRFNGYFGCGLCFHPGKLVDRTVKYPIDVCDYEDRKDSDMLEDMIQARQEGRNVRGVKGPSAFINLEYFPISWGFPADFMHCLLLGVVRQIAELWFSSAGLPYYIGSPRILSVLNDRVKSIKPPSFVARAPRIISDRKFWKATEWYMWLLFYSLPCLSGILPDIYMNHWVILVQVSFLLLQKSISPEELNRSDMLMVSFVGRMQILYGSAAMTFNVHSLLHLPKSVSMWGPLWTHSCFPFESFNWRIKQQLQGYRGIITQVMRKFLVLQNLPNWVEIYSSSPLPSDFCKLMLNKRKIEDTIAERFGNIYVLGTGKYRDITRQEMDALQRSDLYVQGCNGVQEFQRMYKNGMFFYSTKYRVQSIHRNNSLMLLPDQRIGELQCILNYNEQCILIIKVMIIREEFPFVDPNTGCKSHLRITNNFEPEIQIFPANAALGNCVSIVIDGNRFVGRFPNYVSIN
ncbi:uncharacterized protein LOC135157631 [Lytechinus pictus]|uniref:uncharacterized protein LOC135157631 n=1 Tax=Lytechinus pictus TaxID=7653 RepID=UPI0030B9EF0D